MNAGRFFVWFNCLKKVLVRSRRFWLIIKRREMLSDVVVVLESRRVFFVLLSFNVSVSLQVLVIMTNGFQASSIRRAGVR